MSRHFPANDHSFLSMNPRWLCALGFLLMVIPGWATSSQKGQQVDTDIAPVRLTILYDNNVHNPDMETAWGFGCLIEVETKKLLFDTGRDGELLLRNMQKMKIDPEAINAVIISHFHSDHLGGLHNVLQTNPDLPVFLPEPFPKSANQSVFANRASRVGVSGPLDIFPQMMSLGVLSNGIQEQSIAIRSPQGWIILTGCAHPGVIEIIRHARTILESDQIYLVLGGFHLGSMSRQRIETIVKNLQDLGVQNVAPCHCSGNNARAIFHEAYKDHYIEAGAGIVLHITSEVVEVE